MFQLTLTPLLIATQHIACNCLQQNAFAFLAFLLYMQFGSLIWVVLEQVVKKQ